MSSVKATQRTIDTQRKTSGLFNYNFKRFKCFSFAIVAEVFNIYLHKFSKAKIFSFFSQYSVFLSYSGIGMHCPIDGTLNLMFSWMFEERHFYHEYFMCKGILNELNNCRSENVSFFSHRIFPEEPAIVNKITSICIICEKERRTFG